MSSSPAGLRLSEEEPAQDHGAARPAGRAEPVAVKEVAEETCERRLEREDQRGPGGGRRPLHPALDEVGECAREEAAPQTVQPCGADVCPSAAATTTKPANETTSSTNVSASGSKRGAKRDTTTIWQAWTAALANTSPSPGSRPRWIPERSARPATASATPSQTFAAIRSRKEEQRDERGQHDVEAGDEARATPQIAVTASSASAGSTARP